MANKKMGYEKVLYYGTAGSQAGTQLTIIRDVTYNVTSEKGETTANGDGSTPPITTERVTGITAELGFDMINDSSDASLASMIAAARAGTTVALYYKDYSSGKGFDGDVILEVENGAPYKGEQTFSFTARPNDDDRTPSLNAS
jgi:hypothetical protein